MCDNDSRHEHNFSALIETIDCCVSYIFFACYKCLNGLVEMKTHGENWFELESRAYLNGK